MPAPDDETTFFWGLASEHLQLEGAALAHRASAPWLALANYLYGVEPRDVAALEQVLAAAAERGVRRLVVSSRTPAWVEAELLLSGWAVEPELRLVLPDGAELAGRLRRHDVVVGAEADPDWTARRAMLRVDHLEEDARHGLEARPASRTAAVVDHRRELERHATYLCAVRQGEVTGFVCTWLAPPGTGVIEDVFVAPEHRGHGVATALLHAAVTRLRGVGAGAVSIAAEVGDTPGLLYARLGFRPHRVVRSLTAPTTS